MYVLDTTALSALMRSEANHVRRLLEVNPADVRLPQSTLAEVRYGLARLGKRTRRRRTLEERLRILLDGIERATWDDLVSEKFGELKASLERRGRRLEDFDLMMAAHALTLEATLVTNNVRHFVRIPSLTIEDWSLP